MASASVPCRRRHRYGLAETLPGRAMLPKPRAPVSSRANSLTMLLLVCLFSALRIPRVRLCCKACARGQAVLRASHCGAFLLNVLVVLKAVSGTPLFLVPSNRLTCAGCQWLAAARGWYATFHEGVSQLPERGSTGQIGPAPGRASTSIPAPTCLSSAARCAPARPARGSGPAGVGCRA